MLRTTLVKYTARIESRTKGKRDLVLRIVLLFTGIVVAGCATTSNQQVIDRTTAPEAVVNILWEWVGTDASNDACVVKIPQRYTIRFLPDSRIQVKLDCNNGGGSYKMSAGKLSFGPLISTRKACEPDSLDGRYMKDLQQVVAFFVQNDVLSLELSGNSGTMRFRRADEQTSKK